MPCINYLHCPTQPDNCLEETLLPGYQSLFPQSPHSPSLLLIFCSPQARSFVPCSVAGSNHSNCLLRLRAPLLTVFKSPFLSARMSSKFNVQVKGCSGSVVFGDNACIHVGSPATDGEYVKYASHRD